MSDRNFFDPRAKWISAGKNIPAPMFRKEFFLKRLPENAIINICACGFFEIFINGRRVGEDYFKPVWSNYDKITCPILDLEVSKYRIYRLKYNITEYLTKGENVLAVMLGKGWYMQDDDVMQKMSAYGDTLKFIADAEIISVGEKINIFTDESFLCSDGFITFTNIYYGEKQDFSLHKDNWAEPGFDCREWRNAVCEPSPNALITLQECPSDKISEVITPRLVYCEEDYKIYDAGVNISGFAEIVSEGGDIEVSYAENLKDNGTELDYDSTFAYDDKTISRDCFFNTEKGQTVHPYFVWHGFRYICVRGKINDVFFKAVHTFAPVCSGFESDNEVLNWYYKAFIRTQLNNMHCGVPMDCPHRERKGYTGDGQLVADASMLTLKSREFYRKWIRDILDTQDKKTGFVPYTAPYYGGGGGVGGWGSAVVIVPYEYYWHYGDADTLKKCFPHMLKWIDCLERFTENGLVTKTQYRVYNLGEWCAPDPVKLPESFVNTYFYIKCLMLLKEISIIIGIPCGVNADIRIEKLKKALKENFYDEKKDSFCNSVQGADLFAADIGLASDSLIDRTAKKYEKKPVFDTGIFGTELLLKMLFERGYENIAYKLLSSKNYPSFGYMASKGATTLWETWDGKTTLIGVNSNNHPMFGASAKYLFYGILGIKQIKPAFKTVLVRPSEIEGLNYYRGYIDTINGKIEVEYNKTSELIKIGVFADEKIDLIFRFGGKDLPFVKGVKNSFVFQNS